MAVLTVADVLSMPVLRAAGPSVVAGERGLTRRVRWVHSAELADIAPLLRAGDLLLSTGIAMPEGGQELERYAESLAESQAAGLVIELGRRWAAVPTSLVQACERLRLPLVALTRRSASPRSPRAWVNASSTSSWPSSARPSASTRRSPS